MWVIDNLTGFESRQEIEDFKKSLEGLPKEDLGVRMAWDSVKTAETALAEREAKAQKRAGPQGRNSIPDRESSLTPMSTGRSAAT
jgi:hypothetical protein